MILTYNNGIEYTLTKEEEVIYNSLNSDIRACIGALVGGKATEYYDNQPPETVQYQKEKELRLVLVDKANRYGYVDENGKLQWFRYINTPKGLNLYRALPTDEFAKNLLVKEIAGYIRAGIERFCDNLEERYGHYWNSHYLPPHAENNTIYLYDCVSVTPVTEMTAKGLSDTVVRLRYLQKIYNALRRFLGDLVVRVSSRQRLDELYSGSYMIIIGGKNLAEMSLNELHQLKLC